MTPEKQKRIFAIINSVMGQTPERQKEIIDTMNLEDKMDCIAELFEHATMLMNTHASLRFPFVPTLPLL